LAAAYRVAAERSPDVIVVDFRLLKSDADVVNTLKSKTAASVARIAAPEEVEQAPEALKAGAKGYLSFAQTPEEFIHSLSLLARGNVVVSRAASQPVQSKIKSEDESEDASGITEQEKYVVVLVARGATNREIADKLMISQHTVKAHLHNILNKLDLRNRQHIAAYAIKQGLVDDIRTEDFS